ncbi:MAG: ABC transporter ATP-binding protein [Pseudomonadota bacterium]
MSALRVEDVRVRRGGRRVLDGVSLSVAPGEVLGVVGPNGAGKTTLLRAALGLARLDAGRVELGGRDVGRLSDPQRARLAAYLPQERHVGWNMTAERVAGLGALNTPAAAARARAVAALGRVGLAGFESRGVLEMSGGERARVLLARLLVTEAPLLVADEPVAGLDPDAQLLALELFREEAVRGAAVVVTLHDLGLAARFCDRLVVLADGRVHADAPPVEALTPLVLQTVFGLDGRLETSAEGPILVARRGRAR